MQAQKALLPQTLQGTEQTCCSPLVLAEQPSPSVALSPGPEQGKVWRVKRAPVAVWSPGHRTLQGRCPLPPPGWRLPGAGGGRWVGGLKHPSPSDPAADAAVGLSAFCCSMLRAGAPTLQPRQHWGDQRGAAGSSSAAPSHQNVP